MFAQSSDRERQISDLKRQIDELKQSEKDYSDLNFLLTNLEQRYKILCEEKQQIERDNQEKQEQQIRQINQFRVEIETLKDNLRSKNDQIEDLQSEIR